MPGVLEHVFDYNGMVTMRDNRHLGLDRNRRTRQIGTMTTNRNRPIHTDAPVRWNAAMRPPAEPDVAGTVFIAGAVVTYVRWEDGRTMAVATRALVRA